MVLDVYKKQSRILTDSTSELEPIAVLYCRGNVRMVSYS